jgi:hypothetical protein
MYNKAVDCDRMVMTELLLVTIGGADAQVDPVRGSPVTSSLSGL